MEQVVNLALPFFGLIFIGWGCAKWRRLPAEGLAWLNFFIVYVSLPALFFQLLSKTPIEQLTKWSFVVGTTFSTYAVFAVSLLAGILFNKGDLRAATIVGVAGAYSNVGYMGPGLTLATLGPEATVPTALVFCFDNALLFTLAPLLMALAEIGRAHV
jgi:predicted permease